MPINQRTTPKRIAKPVDELSVPELWGEYNKILSLFEPAHRNARVLMEIQRRIELE